MSHTSWWTRPMLAPTTDLERGAVSHAQRVLGLQVTGMVDDSFRARLRGFQALMGIPVTAVLDEATAIAIDSLRNEYA